MRRTLAALVVVLGFASSAQAGDMARTIDDSLKWLSENSDYRLEDLRPSPTWAEMTPQQFRTQAINHQANENPDEIVGMYVCRYRAFYFNTRFDLGDMLAQSFVVHEMVHHGQCLKNRFAHDDCGAEREAYALQAKWLRAQAAANPRHRDWIDRTAKIAESAAADKSCGFMN
jgi:hypothetical protein